MQRTRSDLAAGVADVPDRLHGVPFVMHKGGERLEDSHKAGKCIFISMERPYGLASIAENKDMLSLLPPRL